MARTCVNTLGRDKEFLDWCEGCRQALRVQSTVELLQGEVAVRGLPTTALSTPWAVGRFPPLASNPAFGL